MSFHTLPVTVKILTNETNLSAFRWLTRIVLPFVLGALVVTSSGCSMVAGIFGPTDAAVIGADVRLTRVLMPTPLGERSPSERSSTVSVSSASARNEPTPTPFVMRPARLVASNSTESVSVTTSNATSAVSESASTIVEDDPSARPRLIAIILGDSVNVRNAPGLDTQILTAVARDTQFEFIDETETGDWIQICCVEDQLAWVYGDLVRIASRPQVTSQANSSSATSVTTAQPTSGQNVEIQSNPVQVNTSQTSLPGTSLPRIGLNRSAASTTFTSTDDGFSLTLPPAWLALAESNGLIQKSIELIREDNSQVAALLEKQLSSMSDIPIALIAFDLASESLSSGFATNVNIMRQPVPAGIPLDYVVQLNADQLEEILGLSEAAESTTVVLPAGEAVMLDYQLGGQIVSRQYYLLHEQSLYIITFTASSTLSTSSTTVFDEMMQTLKFVIY